MTIKGTLKAQAETTEVNIPWCEPIIRQHPLLFYLNIHYYQGAITFHFLGCISVYSSKFTKYLKIIYTETYTHASST